MIKQNKPMAVAGGVLALVLAAPLHAAENGNDDARPFRTTSVNQPEGKIVYWVLPGPRVLSEETFGTPDDPTALFKPKLETAKAAAGPATVPGMLEENPIMVGVPEAARSVTDDGTYVMNKPTAFSDRARIISGQFETVMRDVVQEDTPGRPDNTPDSATFEASFNDPAGNSYRVVLDHVVKPPLPGYETRGGVLTDGVLHGDTGTGTPLMPRQTAHGAWWGLGELYINDELVDDHRMMHLMTTEVVRDRDYSLAHTNDLPLDKSERHIPDQEHHTHLMMPPIKAIPGKGPVFDPLPTAFELPNGQSQPFLHIMFEQDEMSVEEATAS